MIVRDPWLRSALEQKTWHFVKIHCKQSMWGTPRFEKSISWSPARETAEITSEGSAQAIHQAVPSKVGGFEMCYAGNAKLPKMYRVLRETIWSGTSLPVPIEHCHSVICEDIKILSLDVNEKSLIGQRNRRQLPYVYVEIQILLPHRPWVQSPRWAPQPREEVSLMRVNVGKERAKGTPTHTGQVQSPHQGG